MLESFGRPKPYHDTIAGGTVLFIRNFRCKERDLFNIERLCFSTLRGPSAWKMDGNDGPLQASD